MSKRSAFRPLVMDALENRVVLSHVSVTAKAAAKHRPALWRRRSQPTSS